MSGVERGVPLYEGLDAFFELAYGFGLLPEFFGVGSWIGAGEDLAAAVEFLDTFEVSGA